MPDVMTPILRTISPDVAVSLGAADLGKAGNEREPSLILLFGWMDAPPRLLSKYVEAHRAHFPSSDIVVVQSHPSFMYSSNEARECTLEPVVELLLAIFVSPEKQIKQGSDGILVHVLSNGSHST